MTRNQGQVPYEDFLVSHGVMVDSSASPHAFMLFPDSCSLRWRWVGRSSGSTRRPNTLRPVPANPWEIRRLLRSYKRSYSEVSRGAAVDFTSTHWMGELNTKPTACDSWSIPCIRIPEASSITPRPRCYRSVGFSRGWTGTPGLSGGPAVLAALGL